MFPNVWQDKLIAFSAYFVLFIPLITRKLENPLVSYHFYHSLACLILAFILAVMAWLPNYGSLIAFLGLIILFLLWAQSAKYALRGERKEIFLISWFSRRLNIF